MGLTNGNKRLFLLDAYALIFRGYYAFIKNPRINSKGLDTSAIFGFTNTLLDLIKREQPTHLAVAFDVGGSQYRNELFPKYKANRDKTPEAISLGVPYIHQILEALNIPVIFKSGYEADDLIGTLAKQAEKQDFDVYMMTPDKDFAQLVTESIKMYKPASRGGGIEILGIPEVQEKFGVETPDQIVDLLGMMGDASDNIPGFPGVGLKTAQKLLAEFKSMENLLKHTDKLKGKLKENIETHAQQGLLSKQLARIITNVPVDFNPDAFSLSPPNIEALTEVFDVLEFKRLLEGWQNALSLYNQTGEIQDLIENEGLNQTKNNAAESSEMKGQMSLFSNEVLKQTTKQKDIEHTDHFYQLVGTPMAQQLLLENLLNQKAVCFDTETTSLNELEANLVGIAFSYETSKGFYLPFPEDMQESRLLLQKFAPFFTNENILKIGHNLKYDLKVLYCYGIEVAKPHYDTMLAHYVINPEQRHNMDLLAESYLNYKTISIESLIGKKGKQQASMRSVPLDTQKEYAVEDADITLQLKSHFDPILIKNKSEQLFTNIEMPLMPVLARMECEGICIDTDHLKSVSKEFQSELAGLQEQIYSQANTSFNINSPKQLGTILFDDLKITDKPKKTKTGQYATSEEVLGQWRNKHPIVHDILEYRQIQKLLSTYVDALPKQVDPKTNRIHTRFGQSVTATGRLSATDPNLQNIPIRTKRGRRIREAFIPKDEKHVLLAADYSQIELRLIAEMSQEPNMMQAFMQEQDIHTTTAARVFTLPLDKVTKEQRNQAKTINFGIIYGVSAIGLSEQTNLSRAQAKELIDLYYANYPGLKTYIDKQVQLARHQGYVETLLGRRRYLNDIHSQNSLIRSHAERNAINAPVQGSAADIIKIAMVRIDKKLRQNAYQTRMLLQVHDELVFEVPKNEIDSVSTLIQYEMQNAFSTQVPLVADIGYGKNWLLAHK